MHSMQLCTRSNRPSLGKPSPMHSLGATDLPIPLPGKVKARPSLHHPKNNLGLKKGGVPGRVDQNSRGACTGQASKLRSRISFCSSQLLLGILPLRRVPNKQEAWLSQTFLCNMLWEEEPARNFRKKSLPPPSLGT